MFHVLGQDDGDSEVIQDFTTCERKITSKTCICRLFRVLGQGNGDYEVIQDFVMDDWLRENLKATYGELLKERY